MSLPSLSFTPKPNIASATKMASNTGVMQPSSYEPDPSLDENKDVRGSSHLQEDDQNGAGQGAFSEAFLVIS